MRAARLVLALAAETGLPAYHPRTHQGFFRYLLVRSSRASGKLLLCLMTAPGPREDVERIADETVIVRTPQQFIAVGAWYRDFDQLEDAEVRALLEQAAARLPEESRHAAHRHGHSG